MRWEWGRNLYDWRPLFAERHRLPRVGPVPPPSDPAGFERYGFDERGELVVIERHHTLRRVDVDRFEVLPDRILGRHQSWKGEETTSTAERRDGRVISWSSPEGRVEERYEWEGQRVIRVRTSTAAGPGPTYEASWDAGGLRRVTAEGPAAPRRTVWERENRPLEELVSDVSALLPPAVIARLASVPWEAPAWCLLLVKGGGYDALPPELVVGVGRRWYGEAGRELPSLQARDERSLGGGDDPLALLDPVVTAACRRLADRARAGGSPAPLHDLLDELAVSLSADAGSLPLPREPGFFVLVVDLDEGVRPADLRRLPAEAAQRLRRAGIG